MASGSRAVLQICKADGAFRWVYDAASVADEQMLRATQHLLMLLNDAVRAGSHRRTVGELSLVSEEERAQLLQGPQPHRRFTHAGGLSAPVVRSTGQTDAGGDRGDVWR